jgi:hypothetical protein
MARNPSHNLHVSLADTGVYAGLVQVAGMDGGTESADHAALPEPLDLADLAEAALDLYAKHDRLEATVGLRPGT